MLVAPFLWHPSNALGGTTARVAALPFHPRDAMLLGERMQLHLYEPECRAALCRALVDGHRCFGQLLTASDDEPVEVMPLLQVLRSTEHPEEGFSVHVQCVGRLNVLETDRPETNRDGDGGGACRDGGGRCLMTTVAPYQDVHAEREPRELVFQRLECLHASCCDLHAQIEAISQGDVPPVVIPPDVVYDWGHETYLPSFEQPLRALFGQRRRSLCEVDMDAAPLDSLAWLHGTWGVTGERAAEGQLLSFASCGCLPRSTRLQALRCRDTAERFRLTERQLRARHQVLRARSAVAVAVG